ncbi:hypothetical protein NQ317_011217 [Molorchus minor]|uniref:DDE Tnp4 domain-containing protein n=1 Tax=Molorchus minor TaxID=1323400 RepID=A0ABQ9JG55_9CUCU|nr:hypothetical protein NQ317_011217 [Molorchus minor]
MNILVPHVILGDEAFALHEHLMKPYPRNQSPIATHPETTDKLIMCACILYNLLRESNILPTSTNSREKYPLPTENLLPLIHNNVRGANTA